MKNKDLSTVSRQSLAEKLCFLSFRYWQRVGIEASVPARIDAENSIWLALCKVRLEDETQKRGKIGVRRALIKSARLMYGEIIYRYARTQT